MNGWFDPDTWMDVVSQFLLMIGAIGIAILPSWYSTHKSLKKVTDQVVNGHGGLNQPNLRQDVDRAIAAIEALGADIHALRKDLHTERQARTSQVDDLRSDVDRMRNR
jgi:outer membrane murein-binding lipoprotein Lpp